MRNAPLSRHVTTEHTNEVLAWVLERANNLALPRLANDPRAQLAAPCFHVAIEHAQAVVILAASFLDASAMALSRCVTENYVRALWLMRAASDEDIERARQDNLPPFERMLADVEGMGLLSASPLARIKPHPRPHLCRFAQTAVYDLDAGLPLDNGHLDHQDESVVRAVAWVEMLALMALRALAERAGDDTVAGVALERLRGEVLVS